MFIPQRHSRTPHDSYNDGDSFIPPRTATQVPKMGGRRPSNTIVPKLNLADSITTHDSFSIFNIPVARTSRSDVHVLDSDFERFPQSWRTTTGVESVESVTDSVDVGTIDMSHMRRMNTTILKNRYRHKPHNKPDEAVSYIKSNRQVNRSKSILVNSTSTIKNEPESLLQSSPPTPTKSPQNPFKQPSTETVFTEKSATAVEEKSARSSARSNHSVQFKKSPIDTYTTETSARPAEHTSARTSARSSHTVSSPRCFDSISTQQQKSTDLSNIVMKKSSTVPLHSLLDERERRDAATKLRRQEKQRQERIKAIQYLRKPKPKLQRSCEYGGASKRPGSAAGKSVKSSVNGTSSVAGSATKAPKVKQEKSTASIIADARLAQLSNENSLACSVSNESILSKGKNEPLDNLLDCLEELEIKAEQVVAHGAAITADSATASGNTSARGSEKSSSGITNYLDDFDKRLKESEDRRRAAQISTIASVSLESAAKDIKSQVMSKKVELTEAHNTIEVLEIKLKKQHELFIMQLKQTEKDHQARMSSQKNSYEQQLGSHKHLTHQALEAKMKLQNSVEEILAKSQATSNELRRTVERQKVQHQESLTQLKEQYLKAEKERREKWVDEKTQAIKMSTVNALEPEIQRLMRAHKQEIARVNTLHEANILEADERASKKYVEQVAKLRSTLQADCEAEVERERQAASARYDTMLQHEEQAFQSQKRRLYQEIAEEKERLLVQSQRLKKENSDFKEQLEKHQSASAKALQAEFERAREVAEKRHLKELSALTQQFDAEKEIWKNQQRKEFALQTTEQEKVIMDQSKRRRDAEIKNILERLQAEHGDERQAAAKSAENRILRVREKYQIEFKEMERDMAVTQQKLADSNRFRQEQEDDKIKLSRKISNLDDELHETTEKLERLISEKDKVRDVIRDEFSDRLVLLEDENGRLKREQSELRARHRLEVTKLTNQHQEELKAVEERVKQAMKRMEEKLDSMQRQTEVAENRSKYLEELMEEQRKLILQ